MVLASGEFTPLLLATRDGHLEASKVLVDDNAIVFNEEAYELMKGLMMERGIVHQTSECTLRGFTCAAVDMDPRAATPKTILEARLRQVGHQVDDVANFAGPEVKEAAASE